MYKIKVNLRTPARGPHFYLITTADGNENCWYTGKMIADWIAGVYKHLGWYEYITGDVYDKCICGFRVV